MEMVFTNFREFLIMKIFLSSEFIYIATVDYNITAQVTVSTTCRKFLNGFISENFENCQAHILT